MGYKLATTILKKYCAQVAQEDFMKFPSGVVTKKCDNDVRKV